MINTAYRIDRRLSDFMAIAILAAVSILGERTAQAADWRFDPVIRVGYEFDDANYRVEVQCGDYLGEDDIVRLEDNYGREGTTT